MQPHRVTSETSRTRGTSLRTLRWVGLLVFVTIACGRVERRAESTLEGDFSLGEAVATDHGCDGEVSRATHRHTSGGIRMYHQAAEGPVVGGRLRRLSGRLDTFEISDPKAFGDGKVPEKEPYTFWSSGITLGFLVGEGGIIGGASTVFADEVTVWPWARLLLGDLDTIWFEADVGAEDPLYYAPYGGAGVGFQTEWVRGRTGLSLYGHLLPDAEGDLQRSFGSSLVDLGVYADLTVQVGPLGVVLGGLLGEGMTGRVGLSYTLK